MCTVDQHTCTPRIQTFNNVWLKTTVPSLNRVRNSTAARVQHCNSRYNIWQLLWIFHVCMYVCRYVCMYVCVYMCAWNLDICSQICVWYFHLFMMVALCLRTCRLSHPQVPPRCHRGRNILRIDPKRSSAKSSCWASPISAVRQLRDRINMAEFRWCSQDIFGHVWTMAGICRHCKPIQKLSKKTPDMSLLTVDLWCDRQRIQFNEWKMSVFVLLSPIIISNHLIREAKKRALALTTSQDRWMHSTFYHDNPDVRSSSVTVQMFEHYHLTVLSARTRKTLTSHCGDWGSPKKYDWLIHRDALSRMLHGCQCSKAVACDMLPLNAIAS